MDNATVEIWKTIPSHPSHEASSPGRIRRVGWQVIALLMLDGGLRIGEVAALHWQAVDFVKGELEVRATLSRKGVLLTPKSGTERTVPMSSRLRSALEAHTRAEDFVEALLLLRGCRCMEGSAAPRRSAAAQPSQGAAHLRHVVAPHRDRSGDGA
jgi:integrase